MINRNNTCQCCKHLRHQDTEAWGTTVTDKGLVCWSCVTDYGDASSIFYALGTTQSVSTAHQFRFQSELPGGITAVLSFFDDKVFKHPPTDCIGRAINADDLSTVPADVADILQRLDYFKFRVIEPAQGGTQDGIFDYSQDDELDEEQRRNLGLRRLAAYEASAAPKQPRVIRLGRGWEAAPGKPFCAISVEIKLGN